MANKNYRFKSRTIQAEDLLDFLTENKITLLKVMEGVNPVLVKWIIQVQCGNKHRKFYLLFLKAGWAIFDCQDVALEQPLLKSNDKEETLTWVKTMGVLLQ